jgi:hypothetical protein
MLSNTSETLCRRDGGRHYPAQIDPATQQMPLMCPLCRRVALETPAERFHIVLFGGVGSIQHLARN